MIRLYLAPWSTNVERVALALAHKGLPAEHVVIDKADRSPVIAVSGQELVPVIEDAGTVVHDSLAILRHLDESYRSRPLFPPENPARAQVDVFLEWFDRVWKLAPNTIEAELGTDAPDPDLIARLAEQMAGRLDLFEGLLSGRDYLLGDELSAADVAAFPFVKYARSRDPEDTEDYHRMLEEHQPAGAAHPRLLAWVDRIDALPRA